MKLLGLSLFFISYSIMAQTFLFETINTSASDMLSRESEQLSKIKSKVNVENIYQVNVVNDILNSKEISFKVENNIIRAQIVKENIRSEKNYSWFGETTDGDGVFFYINNGKVASKFNLGDYSYTLIPQLNGSHNLVKFNSSDVGSCGNKELGEPSSVNLYENNNLLDDSDCTLRVLIATTPSARQEIIDSGFDIPTFAQLAVDEANMAYIASQINITMELASLIETDYDEYIGDFHLNDVSRFRNGTDGLSITHIYRENYQTDIQVLIRRNETGIFGRAYYIPTSGNPLDQSKAFCTVSVDGITDGRYSFTHEVGHLQGGRHENHETTPFYARGYLSSNNMNALRTIMTRTGAAPCTEANSCRLGVFSNPNIDVNGETVGTNNRYNAKMIEETSFQINNFRKVPTTLLLNEEVIKSNQVSNHLAKSIIDTDYRSLTYKNGGFSSMRAGDEIILRPGTHIMQGAEFSAYIDYSPCTSPPDFRVSEEGLKDDLNELFDATYINVYPNPTDGVLNILFDSEEQLNYDITVYDISGSVVYENFSSEAKTQIDLRHLKQGYYFVEINRNNTPLIKRIYKN